MARPVSAIVDAWSTARFLQPAFAEAGWDCVHVWSSPEVARRFAARVGDNRYAAEVAHDGDLERTVRRLAELRVRHVLAGGESGVRLADELADGLGVAGNGLRLSAARRDKHLMAEAVAARGLRVPEHLASGDVRTLVDWAVERGRWPVVAKPPSSGGTDNVIVCRTAADLAAAVELIARSDNAFGTPNGGALVQEHLDGPEYIVNTVSWEGQHYFTDMWRCAKRTHGAAPIYDLEELLPFDGPEQSAIVPYVRGVLDALDLRYGPAHTELIGTDRGPALLEVGARLHGSIDTAAVSACVDHDHVSATVLAYTRPEAFRELCGRPYRMRQQSLGVLLMSPASGRLAGVPGEAALRGLRSFYSMALLVQVGGPIQSTVDLWTCPGSVYLVHADREVLWQDYRRIRELEQTDLFTIDPG